MYRNVLLNCLQITQENHYYNTEHNKITSNKPYVQLLHCKYVDPCSLTIRSGNQRDTMRFVYSKQSNYQSSSDSSENRVNPLISALSHPGPFLDTVLDHVGMIAVNGIRKDTACITLSLDGPWGRLTKAFEVKIQRYRKSHTKIKVSKIHICCAWLQNFVLSFKGALWNFTHNLKNIQRKICILLGVKIFDQLWYPRVMTS